MASLGCWGLIQTQDLQSIAVCSLTHELVELYYLSPASYFLAPFFEESPLSFRPDCAYRQPYYALYQVSKRSRRAELIYVGKW